MKVLYSFQYKKLPNGIYIIVYMFSHVLTRFKELHILFVQSPPPQFHCIFLGYIVAAGLSKMLSKSIGKVLAPSAHLLLLQSPIIAKPDRILDRRFASGIRHFVSVDEDQTNAGHAVAVEVVQKSVKAEGNCQTGEHDAEQNADNGP